MSVLVTVVIVIALAASVGVLALRRRRDNTGMRSFRRHLDALSPEARREVADRVRRSLDDGPDGKSR